MDSSLITILTNAGIAGVVVVLIIFGVLVPSPYVRKTEQERDAWKQRSEYNEEAARRAVDGLAAANQVIGALEAALAGRVPHQGQKAP